MMKCLSGDAFFVKDPDKLARDFIPKYFDHNKFSSFARQLNFYGFRKSNPLRENNCLHKANRHKLSQVKFYHKLFLRDHPELLCNIERSTLHSSSKAVNKEIDNLKRSISNIEDRLTEMSTVFDNRMGKMLELVEKALKQSECASKVTESPRKRMERGGDASCSKDFSFPEIKCEAPNSFNHLKDQTRIGRQKSVESIASDILGILINDPTLRTAADKKILSSFHASA